jgi:hypothetical protein
LKAGRLDSYLRVVGTNGSLYAISFGALFSEISGRGVSGIDKLLAPYRQAWQLFTGTTASMGRRFLRKQRSYPGLMEIFESFYRAIKENAPSRRFTGPATRHCQGMRENCD